MTGGGSADEDDAIARMLRMTTIAVVGLSSDPSQPSESVGRYLREAGYHVIPVSPYEQKVHGQRAYPDLASVPEPVELVDVFRRSEAAPDVVRQAIAVGAQGVWLQLGILSDEAERLAREAGLLFVQDKCIRTEHRMRGIPNRWPVRGGR